MGTLTVTAEDRAGALAITEAGYSVASPLPRVPSLWGEAVRRSYGVCAHPNFAAPKVYGNTDAWTQKVADLGAYRFRGMCAHNLPHVQNTVTRARALGLKWLATVQPEDFALSDAQLTARLNWIRDNAADVIDAIEGVNEPHDSGPGWVQNTVRVQRLIWEYVQQHMPWVTVVSPSLHASANGAESHHQQLGAAGIQNYFDVAGLHRYSGGRAPGHLLDERLGWIAEYWGDPDVWVTETGYTNALERPSGHVPISEGGADKYALRNLLEFLERPKVKAVIRYELLDDPDPQLDDIESNFGLVRCPSASDPATWTNKPEFATMQTALGLLRDPASTFEPRDVEVSVIAPADVHWLVTTTSNRPPVLWLYRPGTTVWDIDTLTDSTAPAANVNVQWATGQVTVPIFGKAKALILA